MCLFPGDVGTAEKLTVPAIRAEFCERVKHWWHLAGALALESGVWLSVVT